MCPSKANKVTLGIEPAVATAITTTAAAKLYGRPVLQPTCNRVPTTLERKNSINKKVAPPKSLSLCKNKTSPTSSLLITPPISPKSKSPRPPAIKRPGNNNNDSNSLNSSSEKVVTPRSSMIKTSSRPTLERKKSKSFKEGNALLEASNSLTYCSSLITESPGSIAAVRREQMALQQKERKMKIAHYGRSKSANFERLNSLVHNSSSDSLITPKPNDEEKRCSFITPNSGNFLIIEKLKEYVTF